MRLVGTIILAGLLGACGTPVSNPLEKAAPVSTRSPSKSFNLIVSNQSFRDPTALIKVDIDGRRVVDQSFAVGSQHTFVSFPVDLAPGRHQLHATSPTATFDVQFGLPASGTRYGVLLNWNYPDEHPHFTWTFHTEPPVFG